MNQILDHSGPKKVRVQKDPKDTEKIIKVYAIIIIIFALCFIGKGTYSLVEAKQLTTENEKNAERLAGPLIELHADEDELSINVSYKEAIESVSYQWYRGNVSVDEIHEYEEKVLEKSTSSTDEVDDELVEDDDTSIRALGRSKTLLGEGKNSIRVENIGIPRGQNTIFITVVTKDNIISEYIQGYYTDVGVDTIEPEISVVIKGNKKMIVTARDETEISKLIYTVNGGREVEVSERIDKKTIKTEIDLVEGKNLVRFSAVDKANNTGDSVKINDGQEIKYVTEIEAYSGKPTIEFSAEPDFSKIYVQVAYPGGISKIEYEFNGEKREKEFDDMSDKYEIELDSKEGHNVVSVKVYTTIDDVYAEDIGECDYNP